MIVINTNVAGRWYWGFLNDYGVLLAESHGTFETRAEAEAAYDKFAKSVANAEVRLDREAPNEP